jgi:flagellar hook-basal body complex protein FliE
MTEAIAPLRAAQALSVYHAIDSGQASAGDFGTLLNSALTSAIDTGRQADSLAAQAIGGHGDLTQVVTAVSRASLALQTTVAVRDRVLQAYQDIIKMPI